MIKRTCSFFASTKYKIITAITCSLLPLITYAADEFLQASPWDNALREVLKIMTGPTATTVGAIALAGTGYLFLRGRLDIMRLMAIIVGLALIFGAPHLAGILQQHASQ